MKPASNIFRKFFLCGLTGLFWLTACGNSTSNDTKPQSAPATPPAAATGQPTTDALPAPQTTGGMPLMQALKERRTVREYGSQQLSPQMMSNLLWAAFGVNRAEKKGRTAPSAHDLQEISIYVVTDKGVSLYDPFANRLIPVSDKDIRAITGKQGFVKDAPVNLIFVSDFNKFKDDDEDYKKFYSATDTGYISQNVYLFCASEGLVTMVRAYIDKPALAAALGLKKNQHIILAQSVGYPKK
jgi:SagB-type dehydrogenase family enzyme